MLPKNRYSAIKYRERKREIEIRSAIAHIKRLIDNTVRPADMELNILEFGSGDGFQLEHLSDLGRVVSSDIYVTNGVKRWDRFVKCSVFDLPFADETFDIVYSNHVIEHLDRTPGFSDLGRIGKLHCLYAFCVPTNLWLLLSLPAQYYHKILGFNRKRRTLNRHENQNRNSLFESGGDTMKGKVCKMVDKFIPHGHGAIRNFVYCMGAFKITTWQKFFFKNGFDVLEVQPLLLYGPSAWPVLPMTDALNRFNICSSVLFLMKRRSR